MMARNPNKTGKQSSKRSSNSGRKRSGRNERLRGFLFNVTVVATVLALVLLWAGEEGGLFQRWRDEVIDRQPRSAAAQGQRIGIVAGHMDSDSGAICPDGLTEAELVQEIARRVVRRLERAGAEVELLAEYDERLNGYAAAALVSIHADACVDRSGFKVARSESSVIPAVEDRLVACLTDQYGEVSGLPFDSYTITGDMIGYHAFKRVAADTPAAIIETGFMGGDRVLLTARPELLARAIADGVICFLEADS